LLAGYEFLALLVAAGCCWLNFFVLVAGRLEFLALAAWWDCLVQELGAAGCYRLLLAGIFCVGCWQAGIFGIGCLVGLFGAGAWC
jgi:hypothetical protein